MFLGPLHLASAGFFLCFSAVILLLFLKKITVKAYPPRPYCDQAAAIAAVVAETVVAVGSVAVFAVVVVAEVAFLLLLLL